MLRGRTRGGREGGEEEELQLQRADGGLRGHGEGRRGRPGEGDPLRAAERGFDCFDDSDYRDAGGGEAGEEVGRACRRA